MIKEEIKKIVDWLEEVHIKMRYEEPTEDITLYIEIPLDDGDMVVGTIEMNGDKVTLICQEEDSVNEMAWELIQKADLHNPERKNLYEEES